jgi:hypothetical protein
MSRRSYDSAAREKRMSKYRVSDEDLFSYVLRVALLSHLLLSKRNVPLSSPEIREKDTSSRLSAAITNSVVSIVAIGDLFKDIRDGSKSVKFPEKLLKVLEQKLQDIAMGKDAGYSGQLIRRTMAVFYGQFKNETFKRQMKENRKIEELILMFATNATNVLKKDPSLSGDGWKIELNNQIAQFVKMLRECLRNVSHVSPELTARLDTYAAKLAPSQPPSDSGYESASTSRESHTSTPAHVSEMSLARTVAQLFNVPEPNVQKEIEQLRQFCTEKAALTDLKTCLKNINAGAPFPGRREDFESDSAWHSWRQAETVHLQQLMVAMVQFNPELAKSTPSDSYPSAQSPGGRPVSMYSPVSRNPSVSSRHSYYNGNPLELEDYGADVDADEDIQVGHHFTYIPPSPKKFYKRLLELCLVADLERMMSPEVDANEEVSLGILSAAHLDLLNECAVRWRIDHPYRVACFLDLVRQFYERHDVPLECVPEALQNVIKVMTDVNLDKWPIQDSDYLATTYGGLFSVFLSSLYHSMDALPNLKPSEIEPFLHVLEHVRDSGLLERFDVDIHARLGDVHDRIRQIAAEYYDAKMETLLGAPGVNKALPLLLMTDELEKTAKLLDKRFPKPILGQIDVVSLFVEVQIPRFISDVQSCQKRLFESSMNGPTPDVPIQDIFTLYRRTKSILDMFGAFCQNAQIDFDIGSFFEPYVRQWLLNTDSTTGQWVQAVSPLFVLKSTNLTLRKGHRRR